MKKLGIALLIVSGIALLSAFTIPFFVQLEVRSLVGSLVFLSLARLRSGQAASFLVKKWRENIDGT
ncbi:hypothetical protein M5X11_04330 [Paenibacillus alginolyticus]|uniref:hypothetical protein n=1 Tax=Paenibacillus alginolyticus TaxID=59839 RepID=UPI00042A1779|nr:hypothetical protein [Paenibacillus alginolyticus]MCY9664206.1 hypothetical protein [Paenibacillus alginolyticus]